jgi:hypothetical protein
MGEYHMLQICILVLATLYLKLCVCVCVSVFIGEIFHFGLL